MSIQSEITRIQTAVTDITTAIEDNGGDVSAVAHIDDLSSAVATIPTTTAGGFTGHVDAEGLAAIGWTADDIAYYQSQVWWNEVDDAIYIVSQYDKRCYDDYADGNVEIADIATDWPYVSHLPKIDLSGVAVLDGIFQNMRNLFAVPALDTSDATSAENLFAGCDNLVIVPPQDFTSCTTLVGAFSGCSSIEQLEFSDMPALTSLEMTFEGCSSMQRVTFGATPSLTNLVTTFYYCSSLKYIGEIDCTNVTDTTDAFVGCYALEWCYIKNIGVTFQLEDAKLLNGFSYNFIMFYAQSVTGAPYAGLPQNPMEQYQSNQPLVGNVNTTPGTRPNTDFVDFFAVIEFAEKGWGLPAI